MAKLLFVVFLVVFSSPAFALEQCVRGQGYSCVIDGDTIRYRGEVIRMAGFDAPETYRNFCGGSFERQLGNKATQRVIGLLNRDDVSFDRIGEDRYGRTLAVFYIGGQNLADILVNEGLARYWPNGSEFWCN